MSLPLWMLLAFAAWTLAVLAAGVGVGRWALILQGRAGPASFPGDKPHGSPAYRRAVRAHANCVENLPVLSAIVLAAAVTGLRPPGFGGLSVAVMGARVCQTLIHMIWPVTDRTVTFRFGMFMVQMLSMTAMAVELAITAAG
ncbi:MAG: MAPEG family protein [Phenylobacterium sp.]